MVLNPVKDFGQERHFSHRCKEKIQIMLTCQCSCGKPNLFFSSSVSLWEQENIIGRGKADSSWIPLLHWFGTLHLSENKMYVSVLKTKISTFTHKQSKGKIVNQASQLPHTPVALGQGIWSISEVLLKSENDKLHRIMIQALYTRKNKNIYICPEHYLQH